MGTRKASATRSQLATAWTSALVILMAWVGCLVFSRLWVNRYPSPRPNSCIHHRFALRLSSMWPRRWRVWAFRFDPAARKSRPPHRARGWSQIPQQPQVMRLHFGAPTEEDTFSQLMRNRFVIFWLSACAWHNHLARSQDIFRQVFSWIGGLRWRKQRC